LVVIVIISIVTVYAGVPFENCGSGDFSVKNIDLIPNPPQPGKDLTIKATGTLGKLVSAGDFEFTVSMDGFQIHSEKGDLCSFGDIKCPIQVGDSGFTYGVPLPGFIPSGKYEVVVKANQQDSKQLFCVKVTLQLTQENDFEHAHSRKIIDYVNQHPEATWTAGVSSRFFDKTLDNVRDLCGVLPGGPSLRYKVFPESFIKSITVPDTFDSRDEWGTQCASLKEIRDQGACGSCWAVAAVAAMTDRVCIASQGTKTPHLSSQDMVSCCGFSCGFGCGGGFPASAWNYFKGTGLVTGGPWDSKQGCYPYQIESCDHHVNGTRKPCGSEQSTPSCSKQCQDGSEWEAGKLKGTSEYSVRNNVQEIQAEIMEHGPVEAAFSVYEDFVSYKTGVYKHMTGSMLGGHAVKIIGWGEEGGSAYWLVANSWNEDWGDQGLFKIARGNNECGIEAGIVAGLP